MHRQVQRAGRVALLGLVLALGVTACQGGSADFVPPPTAPPTESPTPAPATTTAATNGAGELANATLALPFPPQTCSTEPLQYVNGRHVVEQKLSGGGTELHEAAIDATARADVDHDGTDELIVKVSCSWEGAYRMVVALRSDGRGGWTHLGTVLRGPGTGAIGDVAVTSAGEVVVAVSSSMPVYSGSPYDERPEIRQLRTYAWTGQGFAQTAGPTTFDADPAVATFDVKVAPVTLSGASGANRRDGTIKVTVRANGPQAIPAVLVVALNAGRSPGGDWARCGPENESWTICDLGVLAVGSAVTFDLPIQLVDTGLADGHIATMAIQLDQFRYEPVTIRVTNP